MSTPIIIIAIIALAVVIIYLVWRYEKQRTAALVQAAAGMNLQFSKKGDEALHDLTGDFHLFKQGHSRKITNVMSRSASKMNFYLMDYRYTTGGGKSSHTWRQTVLLFHTGQLDLPEFALRPENVLHRIGGAFGYQDIDFDTYPDFSHQYLLRGSDEGAVRELFTDNRLNYLQAHPKLCIEGNGDKMVFYRSSKRVKPVDLKKFMQQGLEIFKLFQSDKSN